jgi:glycogen phosphorylase
MKPRPVHTFSIIPSLPESLKPLWSLAYNLRWAWKHDMIELFLRLDADLWEETGHNPIRMLGTVGQERLAQLATDAGFVAHMERVDQYLDDYLTNVETTWFTRTYGAVEKPLIGYFSLEFAITECLQIFAGGLGVLAGDHLKSASDLNVPLVGVGLLYQQGYFQQYLNQAGWQQEAYEDNHFDNLPLVPERTKDGSPLMVEVQFPGRTVVAQVWRADVGRVPLYLLDTNIPQNTRPQDRDITDQLYGGDQDLRIRQEILLGIGGYRALKALGIAPVVYHMNEGHSAFLALEHTRHLMVDHGLSFAEAKEAAAAGCVYTTHTPVPAGHDRFPGHLMQHYFNDYATRDLGLDWNTFMGLGRENPFDHNEPFCMTVLAIRLSSDTNGVSRLHGEVSRQMWQGLWPGLPQEEIPISHVTNGVHILSFISRDMKVLYDRYLGPRWREEPGDKEMWQRAHDIASDELWRTHERRRERLVAVARQRLQQQLAKRGTSPADLLAAEEVLDPEALTIGFARRFATYKRATLILRDPDRLSRILNNPDRPVQIIFAGKAHPHDNPGKAMIQEIVNMARQEQFRNRMVFLEDYDMNIARYLVQGCDVWLNTPRRPREASGTSGMKAAANGVLNLSTVDGWWAEANPTEVGWAIGRGEVYDDPDYQDRVEAEALYNLLERDVVPMFYDRVGRTPRRWVDQMKTSVGSLCYFFNTNRMVAEYTNRFYMPLAERSVRLTDENSVAARSLAAWRRRVQNNWSHVRVESVDGDLPTELRVGQTFRASALVFLGNLTPDDVRVELYIGLVNPSDEIVRGEAVPMDVTASVGDNRYRYEAEAMRHMSGRHGCTVRVLPYHPDLVTLFQTGMVRWAQ